MGKKKVAARSDNDITDEAAGQQRIKLAAESKARKAEEVERLKRENADRNKKLAHQESRTDFDISDEAAGQARIKLAAESKARKAEEVARLKAENASLRASRNSAGPKADDDIMDEEAGRARIRLAEESRARRAEEAARIARENKAYHERIKNTKARTDDDDQPGGRTSPTKMTAAAIYSQYRKPPPKADPDARDGHITDYERKMAARGDSLHDFPWSTWASADWQRKTGLGGVTGRLPTPLEQPMPNPTSATHTKQWLSWYESFNTARGRGMLTSK